MSSRHNSAVNISIVSSSVDGTQWSVQSSIDPDAEPLAATGASANNTDRDENVQRLQVKSTSASRVFKTPTQMADESDEEMALALQL